MAKNRLAGELSRREWIGLASFGAAGLAMGGSSF
ncbi:MAG: hypothetical protein RIR86_2775, partial [Acidobacteriota bacterium]